MRRAGDADAGVREGLAMERELGRRRFLQLGAAGAVGALGYGVACAYRFEVNTYRVPVPRLPRSFDGFTIVQLTDLHYGLGIPLAVAEAVVERVGRIEGDVVACTGDYVHGGDGPRAVDRIWSLLDTLRARSGVYSVLGNHDHMWDNQDRSLWWMEQSGQGVRHRAVPITRGADRIWIGGAGDLWFDTPGIDLAFRAAPRDECKILLAHHPEAADTAFETEVDLVLSGHTHGGQISFPPLTAGMSGLQTRSGTSVFICRGIGWYLLPVRVACPPEIAVLRLVPAPDRDGSPRSSG